MLGGASNGNGEKTTIGLISKNSSKFARVAHSFCTFLWPCFARLQCETSRNFLFTRVLEEMWYVFLFTLFFTVAQFHPGGRRHFSFSHRRYQISCCSSNKNVSLVFSISLWLFFSLSFAGLSPYFLFFSIFQICGHDN